MFFSYSTSTGVLPGSSCISMAVGFPALKPVKDVLSQTSTLAVGGVTEISSCALPVWPFDRMALKSERCPGTKGQRKVATGPG